MKAVQFAEYGGPEVLQVVEVPEPHAGPGQGADRRPRRRRERDGLEDPVGLPDGADADRPAVRVPASTPRASSTRSARG